MSEERPKAPPGATLSALRDEEPASPPPAQSAGEADLPTIEPDRYALVEEHGRGGVGRVFRARDRRLERTVAVKQLGAAPDARTAARFVREALVTARLQHPGIVPIYEAGRFPDGTPFYAMRLVAGESLREAIAGRAGAGLDERLTLVPRVLAAAEAIAYAHSEGVVHRDLKPANVMLGPFGETVVVDWGLARDTRVGDDDAAAAEPGLYELTHAEMTRVGAVVGTPAYMPPEQARGEPVDARADVYALGAILYHVLAARPPFEGAPDTVLARVASQSPPSVSSLVAAAPRDLVAIVDKAMAREPAARYPDAGALVRDLSRFLTGQLVAARSYGRLTLLGRWLWRHRLVVGVSALALAALAATGVVSARRIVRERNFAQAERARADVERDQARERGDALLLAQARAWLDRDPTAALAWLKQYPDDGAEREAARALAVDAVSRGVARLVLAGHPEQVRDAAIARDGRRIVTASDDLLQVYDQAGQRTLRYRHPSPIYTVALAPDDSGGVAVGDEDGAVWLLSASGEATRLGAHADWVNEVLFSPSGEAIASAGADGAVMLWSTAGGEPRRLGAHQGAAWQLAFVEGGRALLSAGADGALRRWPLAADTAPTVLLGDAARPVAGFEADATSGRVAAVRGLGEIVLLEPQRGERVLGREPGVRALAFLPGGDVVSASESGAVRRWPLAGGDSRLLLLLERPITALAVDAQRGSVAAGDTRGEIRVWQAGATLLRRGHQRAISGLAFAAADGALLSYGEDGAARLWPAPPPTRFVAASTMDLFRVAFVAGGVATTGRDGGVRLIALGVAGGADSVRLLGKHGLGAFDLEPVPGDASAFVTGAWDGSLILWRDGAEARRLQHGALVSGIAVSPDGAWLASAGADGSVRLWPLAGGEARLLHRHDGEAHDVVFSPDGKLVASCGGDLIIRVSRLDAPELPPRELRGHGKTIQMLQFSPDGRTLASASHDGTLRLWNLDSGEARVLSGHQGRVRAMAISGDGAWIASGSADQTVRLWSLAATGGAAAEPRVFTGHEGEVRHLAFSPDGAWLASAGWDDTVRLWRIPDGDVSILRGHARRVHRVAFSPDGKLLASASQDGSVGIWSLEALVSAPAAGAPLREWLGRVTTAALGASGAVRTPP